MTTIERGRHALGSVLDVKAYAESVGREYQTVRHETLAAEVVQATGIHAYNGPVRTLVEIHTAPKWLWAALVSAMAESDWSVDQTRKKIAALVTKKDGLKLPPYLDIAVGLVAGVA